MAINLAFCWENYGFCGVTVDFEQYLCIRGVDSSLKNWMVTHPGASDGGRSLTAVHISDCG